MFGWKSKSQKQIETLQAQVQELSRTNDTIQQRANQLLNGSVLTESFDYGFANPLLQIFDTLGADWGAPGMIPGPAGNLTIQNLFGTRIDNRINGYNTFITEALLDLLRWVTRYTYQFNPIAQGVVRGLRNYTVKTGHEPEVTPRQGQKVNQALVKQCQNIVSEFHKINKLPMYQQDAFVRALREGEFFWRIGFHEDQGFWLRTVEPEWVKNPDGSREWLFGCYAHMGDQERVTAYSITYDGNPSNGEHVPADEIVHYKRNVDMTIRRGLSDFFATQNVIAGVQKLLGSTVIGEAVRQSIPYIRQYAIASAAKVAILAGQGNPGNPWVSCPEAPPDTYAQTSRPGSVPNISKGLEYLQPPVGDTENAQIAMGLAYQTLAVYWQVPQWMTGGDTGNTNFAQALVAESPMSRSIETEQAGFGASFSECDEKVLKLAEQVGMIPEGTCEKVQVIMNAPSVVVRDTEKESKRNKLLYDHGIITLVTWSNKEGIDREVEKELAAANGEDLDNPKVTAADRIDKEGSESTSPGAEYKRETGK